MVFCVQANFAFRNASRRNQISSNIQTRIAQTTTYGPVSREDYTDENGQAAVSLLVRFTTKAEQDAFWADVITAVGTGINGPVTGSELYRHDCPGDGEHWACEIAERVDW
jgi:hypothetical protein